MIGGAAAGKAHLANDAREDSRYLPDMTLPETRAELVVPLRIGERVLGVLDLQSDRLNAFDEEDVLALQGLADQLAIAIRNADLFEEAREARRLADEANRYKSVFLSNMSHELRTPLSVIIGHTGDAQPNHDIYTAPLPDEYANDLETVRKNGEHLLALISDILDLSKIEAGQLRLKPRVIDLASLFDDTLRAAGGLLKGKPVALRRDYPADLPPAWGDSVRTQQIMMNLLSNAIKFTETGSIT
jgi:signal transduction histidine kinase